MEVELKNAAGQVVEVVHDALRLVGHNGGVWSVSYSPDGARLASASDDGTVRVWDSRSGQELLVIEGHKVFRVSYAPDGARLASASDDGTVRVWDAATGHCLQCWKPPEDGGGLVAWAPSGAFLVSLHGDIVRLWDTR